MALGEDEAPTVLAVLWAEVLKIGRRAEAGINRKMKSPATRIILVFI